MYSLITEYLTIINLNYNKKIIYNPLIIIILNLFKKIIFPDVKYRINIYQLKYIINNIFNFIQKVDLNDYKNELNNFIKTFNNNLSKIGVNIDHFYYKKYAYIDFNILFTEKKMKKLKKMNFNFTKITI